MPILPRTQFGDPVLRARTKPVPLRALRSGAYAPLIRDMVRTMRAAPGVGLAAPQVGLSLRLAVIEIQPSLLRPNVAPFPVTAIVNPRIVRASRRILRDYEGCLSFPGPGKASYHRGLVPRAAWIEVEYLDEDGKLHEERHEGFTARVFQHEIDHLDGIVFVQRMEDMGTLMTAAEFARRVVSRG